MRLEVVDLVRHFGAVKAVDGLSFSFRQGDIYGFVGPNGAGKTTTMRILATLDEPTSGDALLDGVSIVENPEHARRRVGYVPDNLPTHRDMTVRDFLDFFARAYGIEAARRRRVLDGIEEFTRLGGLRRKPLAALSKGMKQRVSLARALVHDPTVLILDEPAAGLDPRARVELRELLRELARQGKAVLISSHILTELSEICHGAVILEQGRILKAGSIDHLLSGTVPRRHLRLRILDRAEELCRELLEAPGVEAARVLETGELALELALDGGPEGEPESEAKNPGPAEADRRTAALLAEIVGRGYGVVELRQHRADLEEIFMSVTRGEVQ